MSSFITTLTLKFGTKFRRVRSFLFLFGAGRAHCVPVEKEVWPVIGFQGRAFRVAEASVQVLPCLHPAAASQHQLHPRRPVFTVSDLIL